MRSFDYKKNYEKLLTPEIVAYLSGIREYRGMQTLFMESQKALLDELLEIAKIQSTEASNRIEGIITTDERLKQIVHNKTTPRNRNEQEIAGYRDVLSTIHENHEYIPVRPGMMLQLHRDLYKFSASNAGGSFKNTDNIIAEKLQDGTTRERFHPVSAWETPEAIERICDAYEEALADDKLDPLLIIPMFILDFLCIHPFNDGNGRMSRLLTLLLLYHAGFIAGRYISIEKMIADGKERYYEALQESSEKWHEGENDYAPFVTYMLGIIVAAYRELTSRVDVLVTKHVSKPERVREIIRTTIGRTTKAEIMSKCPDISETTVERTLKNLLDTNEIIKIGGGRYTSYAWRGEE